MSEYLVIILFILWYTFSMIVSETVGAKRKIGTQWSFFLCIMLSPIIGYVITLSSPQGLKATK